MSPAPTERSQLHDPIARLFDAIQEYSAVVSHRRKTAPHRRVVYEGGGGALPELHIFSVYVDGELVAEMKSPSLVHAVHWAWARVQEWASDQLGTPSKAPRGWPGE